MGLLNFFFNSSNKNQALEEFFEQGAKIIDVRTPAEFEQGHAPGSKNIPLDKLKTSLNNIPLKTPIILCCATGARSGAASRLMKKHGYHCINGGRWQKVMSLISSTGAPSHDKKK